MLLLLCRLLHLRPRSNPPIPHIPSPPPEEIEEDFLAEDDFPAFIKLITSGLQSGKISSNQIHDIIAAYGLPSIPVAATRPDLIPDLMQAIRAAMQ